MELIAGIDIGAASTKAVIINAAGEVLGHGVTDTGADFEAAAEAAFSDARIAAGCDEGARPPVISTGYGRRNVPNAVTTRTEISCHAEGSYHYYPQAHTLIDIGGQDCKVIRVDSSGKRTNFKMNRKCAAGTGAFVEDIAHRLKLKLEDLDGLARKSENNIQLGSYCTVFTGTEILSKIRAGIAVPDIVKGLFEAVIKRVLEMDTMEGDLVMTGGVVAHNPFLVEMLQTKLGKKIFVPPLPQLTGAIGAAIYFLRNRGVQNA